MAMSKFPSLQAVNSNVIAEYTERCYFEYMGRQQWRRYANLGSVLDAQLVYQGKVTRCTQTNWKWRKMAERWRHAKVMEATDVIHIDDFMDRMRQDLHVLREVTSRDKITDTCDLEYDPYDLKMIYTQRSSKTMSSYLPVKYQELALRFASLWRNFVIRKKNSRKSKYGSKYVGSYGESVNKTFKGSGRSVSRPQSRLAKSDGKR